MYLGPNDISLFADFTSTLKPRLVYLIAHDGGHVFMIGSRDEGMNILFRKVALGNTEIDSLCVMKFMTPAEKFRQ